MTDTKSTAETLEVRRKRICYRAWHRGMLEMDMILGHFADAHVPTWEPAQLDRLEQLMDEPDADLFKWVLGRETPPKEVDTALIAELAQFQSARVNS